jgi:arylsulfatase A
VSFIQAHTDKPFFLFLAHSMPHTPLFRSPESEGHSKAGVYGDVIEELDGSVGRVMQALRQRGVAENTLVFFSSDNGPWLTYFDLGGSAGPLRDGKNTTWEGGLRVPAIFWWPGKIKPAVITDIGVNIDLMRTLGSITGAPLPKDRSFDSMDLSVSLLKAAPSPRREWFYYSPFGDLWAARVDQYKLVFQSQESIGREGDPDRGYGNQQVYSPPLLFDLSTDIAERLDIADRHPEVIARIYRAVEAHRQSLQERRPASILR